MLTRLALIALLAVTLLEAAEAKQVVLYGVEGQCGGTPAHYNAYYGLTETCAGYVGAMTIKHNCNGYDIFNNSDCHGTPTMSFNASSCDEENDNATFVCAPDSAQIVTFAMYNDSTCTHVLGYDFSKDFYLTTDKCFIWSSGKTMKVATSGSTVTMSIASTPACDDVNDTLEFTTGVCTNFSLAGFEGYTIAHAGIYDPSGSGAAMSVVGTSVTFVVGSLLAVVLN